MGRSSAGSGLIVKDHNMACILRRIHPPEFRKRGVQTALLRKRLEMAAKLGAICRDAHHAGTASQRNAERAGFRVTFTKAVAVKTLA